jgi:8-oxo-dGTP diphosphatase
MVRFGCVILVDRRGWVLLQERDEHPRIAPEQWGYCGGHLEEGETYLDGSLRELEEETGVELGPEHLVEVGVYDVHHVETGSDDTLAVYAAGTHLTDAGIDCREGRRIVFVDPAEALGLPLTASARQTLPGFLESEIYRSLATSVAP